MEIPWELDVNGNPANFIAEHSCGSRTALRAKYLAFSKMQDVIRVSTDFGEHSVLFERHFDLLVEFKDEAKFIGIYMADSVDASSVKYCVRTGNWAKTNDGTLFACRESDVLIKKYIESRNHAKCRIHFVGSEGSPINGLMKKTDAFMLKGMEFSNLMRSPPPWKYIALRFQCTSAPIEQSIKYYPEELSNEDLEKLVTEWLVVADETNGKITQDVPHAAVRVSYDLSLWERLQTFQ